MSSITRTTTVASGDLIVLYKTSQGDWRGLAASDLLTYLNANLTFPTNGYTTQYAAPSASGWSVTIADGTHNTHLILTPTLGPTTGTIVLPVDLVDKQEVLVNCTQAVATLTINGGSTTVIGEPASLSANDFFRLKYDAPTATWYRIG